MIAEGTGLVRIIENPDLPSPWRNRSARRGKTQIRIDPPDRRKIARYLNLKVRNGGHHLRVG